MSDATYAKHAAVANLEPLVASTQWALVERAFRGGSGLLVRFDTRLVPGVARHFERLAALGDPQIAAPIEYGVDDEEAWLLYAGTLDDALDASSGPLSMGEITQLGDALLGGLERAHDQGFLHPGIGPSLVRMHIAFDGRVHPELLGLGLPAATPRTVQDDLADVAALLYSLYTGRPPFEPGVPRDGTVPPKPFADTRPSGAAPASFEVTVLRALGPRASAFWSAAEMRQALAVVPTRRPTGQRVTTTTDQNLPRLRPREISRVAPLPVSAPIPEPKLPPDPTERPFGTAPMAGLESTKKRRNLWPIAALMLVGAGVALGLLLGKTPASSPTTSAPALAQSAPIEPIPPTLSKPQPEPEPAPAARAPAPTPAPTPPAPTPAPAPAAPTPAPTPATTRVTLTSTPSDSAVTLNGKLAGRTPMQLDLTPTDLPAKLVFERKGMLAAVRTIDTLEGPTAELAVTLKPRPKTPTAGADKPADTILMGR